MKDKINIVEINKTNGKNIALENYVYVVNFEHCDFPRVFFQMFVTDKNEVRAETYMRDKLFGDKEAINLFRESEDWIKLNKKDLLGYFKDECPETRIKILALT